MERGAQEMGQEGEGEDEMVTGISRNGAATGGAGNEDGGVGDGDDQEEEPQRPEEQEEVKGGCFVRIHNATTDRDLQVTTGFAPVCAFS